MILLALAIPFISIVLLGYLVFSAPEVANEV